MKKQVCVEYDVSNIRRVTAFVSGRHDRKACVSCHRYTSLTCPFVSEYGNPCAEPVSTPVWQVSVINPSSFTQIVKMINDVIPECFMKVVNTPGFKGLGFEAVDNANICYLLARLACETHIDESCSPRQLWSCVNMDWVQTIAECVPMQSQLNIVSLNGSDSLLLSAVEMARNGKHIEAEMHTISKDPPTKRMRDLQHAFVIEFGVADLKEIVCTGRGAKADNLAFTILGYKEAVGVGRRNREQMFMEISFVSPMGRMVFLFAHTDASGPVGPAGTGNRSADPTHDTTSDGGSFSAAERTEVDRHLLEEKFSGEYSIKYLSHILKGMQRRSIIIKLDPSAPLFIEYPMGDNLSFVRWLLARRQPDAGQ